MKNQEKTTENIITDDTNLKSPSSIEDLWNSTARAINKNMREIRAQLRFNNQVIDQMKSSMLKTLSYIRENGQKLSKPHRSDNFLHGVNSRNLLAKPHRVLNSVNHTFDQYASRAVSANTSNFEFPSTSAQYRPLKRSKMCNFSNSYPSDNQCQSHHKYNVNNYNFDNNNEGEAESTAVSESEDEDIEESSMMY